MVPRETRAWKCPTFEGLTPSITDWAQIASFIDGEGSILINTQRWAYKDKEKSRYGLALRVTVANTDVRLMHWCKERFGGTFAEANTDKYYEGKNWKRAWHWGAAGARGAWILFNCLPWFVLKREQAEIGIQLQETLSGTIWQGREVPEEIRTKRVELKKRLTVLKSRGVNGVPALSEPIPNAS